MADADHATRVLRILRQHVLDPLATAECILEHEHTEVTVERDAFVQFTERLATIDPVTTHPGKNQARPVGSRDPSADRLERVRAAYRETVMSVSHYDGVYGESLVEHVTGECGRDLAAGLHAETSVSFTPAYKTGLRTAAAKAAQERNVFLDTLDREAASLATARSDLTELLAQLDTTTVPEWHREPFAAQLERVVQDRQETIQTRQTMPRLENHALCEYLYQDPPWTFPVLTAVTRVREAVALS